MKHKVTCLVCGKKGIIDVTIGKKVKSKEFCYFGKLQINRHVGKYHWRVEFDEKTGKMLKDKDGGTVLTRMSNPQYIKGSKRKKIEYWECAKCCGCGKRN